MKRTTLEKVLWSLQDMKHKSRCGRYSRQGFDVGGTNAGNHVKGKPVCHSSEWPWAAAEGTLRSSTKEMHWNPALIEMDSVSSTE